MLSHEWILSGHRTHDHDLDTTYRRQDPLGVGIHCIINYLFVI